jgi:hypothetical protein
MTITINMHEARLVPYRQNGKRPAGIFAGKFFVADDFNDPLPDEFSGVTG